MNVLHFTSPAEFRTWLEKHQSTAKELWLGFWRKDSGRNGLTYSEALDEALCYGWIDGVRQKVDALRYTNRFTPRKKKSHWSAVNLKRVEELILKKRMTPAGLAAHEARDPTNLRKASYEQLAVSLAPKLLKRFHAHKHAWKFFEQQAPYYRRTALWWIASAKREETQLRRLEILITDSAANRRLGLLTPKAKRTS